MDLKHYEQLKPVNEHLAIPAPKGVIDHNNLNKVLGVSFDDSLHSAGVSLRAVSNNKNLDPRNAGETLLLASKTFKTVESLVSFAYSLGATDAADGESDDANQLMLIALLAKLPKEKIRKILEDMLAERGHSHGH